MRRSEFLKRSVAVAALLAFGVHLKDRASTYGVGLYGSAVYGDERHEKFWKGGGHERFV